MLDFIDKSWVKLKIAFNVQDGLVRTGKTFEIPDNMQALSPSEKQRMTACNLFANHDQTIEQLAIYLETDRKLVIAILMEEGFLEDQRRRVNQKIKGGRRATDEVMVHGH